MGLINLYTTRFVNSIRVDLFTSRDAISLSINGLDEISRSPDFLTENELYQCKARWTLHENNRTYKRANVIVNTYLKNV